ncbi:PKD-like family lipoprotein [Pedobacter nyackensis]|uniref:PKD-like family lipoprotein n=1 Tax=Pedobacter nyackensis TaxID=475255 RepID=UPI002930C0D4|nr:PKD-like family lipoprotein [Pedobacter nyackensis]
MMKTRILIIYLVSIALFTSCKKDLGNYDYTASEVITISGIKTNYPVIQSVDKLNIIPEVSSNIEGADFEYVYFTYDLNKGGQDADTVLKNSKDLIDYVVGIESGRYALVFRARNKKTNVSGYFHSVLDVSTRFNDGWYVLKSEGNKSDMDYFNQAGEKIEDVVLSVNGRQLDGDVAHRIGVNDNYADPNKFLPNYNIFEKTRVLIPVTNKDAKAIKLSTGKILNDFPEMFLDKPVAPYSPSMYVANNLGQWILNNGKASFIYSYSSLLSKFGPELAMTNEFKDYRLSKYVVSNGVYDPIGFDELTSSFVAMSTSQTFFIPVGDQSGTEISAKNNNMKLVFAGAKALYDDFFYAVMQDKTSAQLKYIANVTGVSGKSFKIALDKLATNDPAFSAELFTLNHSLLKVMYFVSNNKVYARSVAGIPGRNTDLQISLPQGETATFIKHIKYSNQFDYLIVGTTIGGNYKVYLYPLNNLGEFSGQTPAKVFSGKGKAGDISFVFPSISQTTFPLTY